VDFAIASVILAACVIVLAAFLPGAARLPVGVALAVFASGAVIAGRALGRGYPHARLGLCNLVTLGRLALAATLVVPLIAGIDASWPVFAVAAIALALDGVDGWLARRQGLASAFGARFDMEVDAALALILSLSAAAGPAGPAAILLGVPRYLFVAAARLLPWMRRDLPARFSRKAVCVLQLAVLIALQAPVLPQVLALPLVVAAGGALVWSFALDLVWLWRKRRT
jgi:phosphatidylglycerophosphate synthase